MKLTPLPHLLLQVKASYLFIHVYTLNIAIFSLTLPKYMYLLQNRTIYLYKKDIIRYLRLWITNNQQVNNSFRIWRTTLFLVRSCLLTNFVERSTWKHFTEILKKLEKLSSENNMINVISAFVIHSCRMSKVYRKY